MKKTFLAMAALCGLFSPQAKGDMAKSAWFKNTDCTQLDIINYKSLSDDKTLGFVSIKDKAVVKLIVDQISSLPGKGDEHISFAKNTKRTLLSFKCGSEWQSIEIYGGKFKTPATTFNSAKNETEERLAADLESIATPKLEARMLKLPNHPFDFKGFRITFKGSEHTPQPPGGPTVGPTSRHLFEIGDQNSGNTVTVSIFEGQVPPQPQAFVVGKKIYYLITHSFAKEPLYPKYFLVSEKLPRRG